MSHRLQELLSFYRGTLLDLLAELRQGCDPGLTMELTNLIESNFNPSTGKGIGLLHGYYVVHLFDQKQLVRQ